jgi:hypothetical protein
MSAAKVLPEPAAGGRGTQRLVGVGVSSMTAMDRCFRCTAHDLVDFKAHILGLRLRDSIRRGYSEEFGGALINRVIRGVRNTKTGFTDWSLLQNRLKLHTSNFIAFYARYGV